MREALLKSLLLNLLICFTVFSFGQKISFRENDPAVAGAHVGICIYDPSANQIVYELNAGDYFTPASTNKIFSLYAGMKFIGDSLPGIKVRECPGHLVIEGTGDPTLLHPRFQNSGIMNFLARSEKKIFLTGNDKFRTDAYGPGWPWEDYEEAFMPERSPLPLFGNLVHLGFRDKSSFLLPGAGMKLILADNEDPEQKGFSRKIHSNEFTISYRDRKDTQWSIPFITSEELCARLLEDTLHKSVELTKSHQIQENECREYFIKTIPADSMFAYMMHESDNFLAEQTLLMASYLRYGFMDEKKLIDYLLQNELSALPQKPRWVDGSGLSRYNLASPRDQVYLLDKLQKEFGNRRIETIFPSGGKGTLKGQYLSSEPYLFAKTGTMSNNNGLCGYLKTRKGKTLFFSILVNHYTGKAAPVRRLMEDFLKKVRNTY